MKILLLTAFLGISFCPQSLLAWGNGHDDVNRIALKILPAEIIKQLSENVKKEIVTLSHVPDDFTPWTKWNKNNHKIFPADMKVLEHYKMKHPYSLHSTNGQAVNFILLVNAFKANSPERIALWMACLLHTFADEGAANHDPLIGCMMYTFGGEYKMKIGKGIGLDFAIIARNNADRKIIYDLLKNIEITPLTDQPEEALLKVMMLGLESNAYLTRRGSAIAASYAQDATKETVMEAKKALAELGVYGAVKACDVIVTAWNLAKNNTKLELTDEIKKEYTRRKAEFIKNRPLADDSLFAELLKKQTMKESAVGVLVEPSISMDQCKLAFSSKLLASAIMRTLSAAKIPFRLVDIRDLENKGLLPPKEMPVLIVCAGKFRVNKSGNSYLDAYLNTGGKFIWIGGEHKDRLGKLSSYLIEVENEKLPVNLRYGKKSLIGETVRFKFNKEFSEKLSQKEYGFVHCPNTKAGWQVPKCRFLMKKTNDKNIMVLAEMRVDKELTPIAGALIDNKNKAKIIFLPEYLIAPYLLSDEDTVSNPAELQLDRVGKEILMSSVKLLDIQDL